jgi:hypothetical protein
MNGKRATEVKTFMFKSVDVVSGTFEADELLSSEGIFKRFFHFDMVEIHLRFATRPYIAPNEFLTPKRQTFHCDM